MRQNRLKLGSKSRAGGEICSGGRDIQVGCVKARGPKVADGSSG